MTPSRAQDTLARVAASTERGLAAGIVGPVLEFAVYGLPGPQGSKKAVGRDGKGRAILVEMSKRVKPWRAAVKAVAMLQPKMRGPLRVEMIFTMPKPKSAPKRRRTWPATRPDASKLIRSTEDALTDSGVIEDDGRIVDVRGIKCYPMEHPDALTASGALIRIWGLT